MISCIFDVLWLLWLFINTKSYQTCLESLKTSLTSATFWWSWWWLSSCTLKGNVSRRDLASLSNRGRNCLLDVEQILTPSVTNSRYWHSWVILWAEKQKLFFLWYLIWTLLFASQIINFKPIWLLQWRLQLRIFQWEWKFFINIKDMNIDTFGGKK